MKRSDLEEKIVELFYNEKDSIKLNYISKKLAIKSDSQEYYLLKDILHDLCDRQIIERLPRRKYILKDWYSPSLLTGFYFALDSSHYVETGNPKFPKIYIKKNYLKNALPGDKVKVQLFVQNQSDLKKLRGEVVEIVERCQTNIVGKIEYDGNYYFLIPDDPIYLVDFLIPNNQLNGAVNGDKVSAKLLNWSDSSKSPKATVIEIIGEAGKSEVEFNSILMEFNLKSDFPEDVLNEASIIKAPINRSLKSRLDLREELIITIDPFDAKDFDDALSCKILENGNYYLGVHIADVSHYIAENSALDIEAKLRGNSTYLVDRVIPMLPENLSNDICSLKPDVPRFCFSVFMEISSNGDVLNYSIAESIINSKKRYNYDEVLNIINGLDDCNKSLIINLYSLSSILREKRNSLGSVEFDTLEYKFLLDEEKLPIKATVKKTTPATSLVEECMLLCNKTVCEYINVKSKEQNVKIGLPFIYRVHDYPEPKKMKEALNFLEYLSGKKINKSGLSSSELNQVLKEFKDTENWDVVNSVLIRSMAKAEYSVNNIGHYGLAFDEYTHFTSPIRRYADLMVHRLIKKYMQSNYKISKINIDKLFLKGVAKHITETERVSMLAERASNKYSFTLLAQKKVGEVFNAKVTGIAKYGIYAQLDDIYCEGLLHIKDLWDDYYIYDESKMQIFGRRNKKIYTFGSEIKVKIIKVNLDKREIDLELAKK